MNLQQFIPILTFSVFLLSLMLHEIAHGYTAFLCGDPTARNLGRISLSPIKHIDYLGSLLVPLILFVSGSTVFGWAKPVPVNFDILKKRNKILVSCAGIVVNLILATAGLIAYHLTNQYMTNDASLLVQIGCVGVFLFFPVNLMLLTFNLLPIPPLDGWMIFTSAVFKTESSAFLKQHPYLLFLYFGASVFILKVFVSPYLVLFIKFLMRPDLAWFS